LGQERGKTRIILPEWDWIKSVGEGDPSKGIDKLVMMYLKRDGKENLLGLNN
jgi:hypothetical protein